MEKNLTVKLVVIVVLVLAAIAILYPPQERLKRGIDLAGGTSLIYEIDTQGLGEARTKDLAARMITVLRRRIDPANIQNLVWRPQGDTRFEIQMPLADARARQLRKNYQDALNRVLENNINPAAILRLLKAPAEKRASEFTRYAQGSEERLRILEELASVYDQRQELRGKVNELNEQLKTLEGKISFVGLDLDAVKENRNRWRGLDEAQLKESLRQFLGSDRNISLLSDYVKAFGDWADVSEELTKPEEGLNIKYQRARASLDELNLSEDQIEAVLSMPEKSVGREQALLQLKADFPERDAMVEAIVSAFDEYRPYRGRLDDPKDLQRMLKGAGILEFRLLPTVGHPEVNSDLMAAYVEKLKSKGPKYASDDNYVWCEVENISNWSAGDEQGNLTVLGQFGDKYYVLASNDPAAIMTHAAGETDWKLKHASPGTEGQTGQRAIDFVLDDRGGKKFGRVTGKNIGRPLCILLDGVAISAPKINSRITTRGQITGRYAETEQRDMVDKLNAGSLPAMLIEQPVSIKSIGPSIGADNRDKGIKAGMVGLVLVVLIMLVYYMAAGAIADVALLMNILFVLAMMALLRATFTLPGIAGIILTIGMTVDANVLIFERIREEQQKGSSLRIAIKNGYQRAFRTIFDANLTTFMTAAILYWVASEEIKGFAIVLMLGIASSMFTALFVTRLIFSLLLSKRIVKDQLVMLRLIKQPQINWMGARGLFLSLSTFLIAAGLFVFFTRDDAKNNKYDIEFTGGTSVQINLKEDVELSRQDVADRIRGVGIESDNPALAAANVYSVGKSGRSYEINTTETNKTITEVTVAESGQPESVESLTAAIAQAADKTGAVLSNLRVTAEGEGNTFTVTTSQMNKSIVKSVLAEALPEAGISEPVIDETVNGAILSAFSDELQIQRDLEPQIIAAEKIGEDLVESYPELADFVGGVKITFKVERAATAGQIQGRLADLRFKPDTRNLNWYPFRIVGEDLNPFEADEQTKSFVYISAEPEAGLREWEQQQWDRFVENEKAKVLAATRLETSLPRVTQIDPSIGAEARTRALIAIVLSLAAIVAYIWVRFGDVRYGLAAIIALVHDVCITLGAVTACTYIAATPLGEMLLIGDFKINLAMIAAFLTLIGYSLNDTIVVFDRIRENRHKGGLNAQIITNSINQTISRTLMTSLTTFIVVLVMYIFGGQALRGFTFAIGFGIIIGTYSSIAIAAPVLLLRFRGKGQQAN